MAEEYVDVRCEVCGRNFGDGQAAYKEAVEHLEREHGLTE